ncbi:MAG: serine/threonine-protein kinase [Planctomycetota bacterium]
MGFGNFFKSLLEGGKVDVARRYEFLREAVSGTMSDFHMARDRETGDIVGLKILDKQKTEQLESRFRGAEKPSEGRIAASFDNPLIVTTLSHGVTTKNEQFLVMEFLDGPGLNSLIIGRSQLLDGNRLTLMRQAAEALSLVHDAGYIHRDICPRNFVCAKDATSLKLIDFGLTVPAEGPFLQPGIRTGTPNYMAPEVVRRKATDKRLDIFSFGVSMYELFTFTLPWARGSDGLAAMSHGESRPAPISNAYPKIAPDLEQLIFKCIEAEPRDRPASMNEVTKMLKRLRHEDA